MISRVNKAMIGGAIARTSSPVLNGASQNCAAGEIFVLDKNKDLLSAGATVADTDTIYIAQVLADTYSYVTEGTSTSVTGVKRVIYSDPIEGSRVVNYTGRAYSAIVEQVTTIGVTTFTPTVGTEYVIRIVYTDTYEKPGQVTQTYRYVATTAVWADLVTAFIALINKDTHRRVTASGSSTLILTGRAMPYDVSDTVNAIDEYYQVNFKAYLYSNNFGDATVTYTTKPFPGNGTWQRVRDIEKWQQSNRGVRNRTLFPVITPAMVTSSSVNYNCIVIEHNNGFVAPDFYDKTTKLTTEIYIPTTGTQMTNVLQVLNPWMASTAGAFTNITF